MQKAIIHLAAEGEDLVEELLWIKGALSVSSQPPHVTERHLEALFDQRLEDLEAHLSEYATITSVSWEEVVQDAWQDSWRANFKPLQVGSFTLMGEWEAKDDPKVVKIYPGTAFGTGHHATTQLIIKRLEHLNLTGKHVLDAGCGTGILSIVAERLGAEKVLGFDVDPDCHDNMQHHLAINGTNNVTLVIGAYEQLQLESYDVILANITINVLHLLWPHLGKHLKPGGILISSGILVEQEEEAREALQKAGFSVTGITRDGEWLLIEALPR